MQNIFFITQSKRDSKRGFTFIELMVVMALITILTAVIVSQDRTHAQRILMDDLAYRIALSIREVQAYGVSSKEFRNIVSAGALAKSCATYGVVFTTTAGTFYNTFADLDDSVSSGSFPCPPLDNGSGLPCSVSSGTGSYCSTDPEDVLIERIKLKRGQITQLCTTNSLNVVDCSHTAISIAFRRPNPEAIIQGNNNYSSVSVTYSDSGATRKITVRKTGQVVVTTP